MSKFTDELCELVKEITLGTCPKRRVRKALDAIQSNNPDETFEHYKFERKEKPWDLAYLKELEELFYYGASSREFIEYMAEVSDEIYRAKRIKKMLLITLVVIAAIAAIIAALRFCLGD